MIVAPHAIQRISKEELKDTSFQDSAGYFTDHELRDRNRKLHLSILLADYTEGRVKIVFNTVDGYKELHTAIWGATDKHVVVKGGVFIPVEAIAYVSLNQQA